MRSVYASMWKPGDWECKSCGGVTEHFLSVPHGGVMPQTIDRECAACGFDGEHTRRLALIAPYMGEKVHNPMVSGGKFDTVGNKRPPSLPTLPQGATGMDYKYLFDKPEYKETERERARVVSENKTKRKRAAALKKGGTVNMRVDKVAGDPAV